MVAKGEAENDAKSYVPFNLPRIARYGGANDDSARRRRGFSHYRLDHRRTAFF